MSIDLATLAIAVDSRTVVGGARDLDNFVGAGKRAEDQASRLRSATNSIRDSMLGVSHALGPVAGVLTALGPIGIAAAVGLGATTLVAKHAIDAYTQLEKEQATYNAVLAATGVASGKTSDDIEDLAQSIRRASTATEGEVRQAAAIMLTFRSVAGESFDEALKLSQDLAAVGFGSIVSAATMLGKALEDPINGLTALRRVGVSFSDSQRLVIKNLIETGKEAQAQAIILQGVRQQVGGAGAAQSNTLVGAWNQLGEATNNWLERVGTTIERATGLKTAIRSIADAIDEVNKKAEHGQSPQGILEDLIRQRDAITAKSSIPQSGLMKQGVDSARSMLDAKIAAAQEAAEFDNLARAQSRLTAGNAEFEASEQNKRAAISGLTGTLLKENELLRMGAIEREAQQRLRAAQVGQDSEANKASIDRIKALATEQFYLKNGTQLEQQRIAALGDAASIVEVAAAKRHELNKAVQDGLKISKDEISAIVEKTKRDALGITQIQSSTDSYRVEAEAIGMTVGQAAAYTAVQNVLNEARRNGRVLTEDQITALRAEADVMALALQRVDNLRNASDLLAGGLKDVRNELMQGKTVWQALGTAAQNILTKITDQLIDMASKKLVANALGGGGGGILSLFSGLFGGSSAATGSFGHNASGTENWGGGLTWVGEKGPELVNLPSHSQVIPKERSMQIAQSENRPIVLAPRINNYGADVQTSTGDDGQLEITVRAITRDEMVSPRAAPGARARYGTPVVPRSRG